MEDDHEKCLLYLLIIGLLFSFVSCNNETPSVLDGDDNTHPYFNIDKDGSIYCIGKEVTEAEIPEYFNGIKVTSIKDYAFLACKSLVSVKIPDSVKVIGEHAFDNCTSLKSVVLPDSVVLLHPYAFIDCTSLESVKISDR